jgi:hypothetical protein
MNERSQDDRKRGAHVVALDVALDVIEHHWPNAGKLSMAGWTMIFLRKLQNRIRPEEPHAGN